MSDLMRRLLGRGLVVAGSVVLISPVRRHRAKWQVSVGDRPAKHVAVQGGEFAPSAEVLVDALRTGDRRPDAEFRCAVALALIGSGLGLRLIPARA
jgi:hypothetical protein